MKPVGEVEKESMGFEDEREGQVQAEEREKERERARIARGGKNDEEQEAKQTAGGREMCC